MLHASYADVDIAKTTTRTILMQLYHQAETFRIEQTQLHVIFDKTRNCYKLKEAQSLTGNCNPSHQHGYVHSMVHE